ncbi:MAG: hypothetical protein MJ232_06140 [archaeon]|nr:hypothetical protein [archaeon]
MANKSDISRNKWMLTGSFAKQGYDWWWHSFTGVHSETGEERPFFIEFFTCNPALGGKEPVFGQLPQNKANGIKPSYLMVKAGGWGEDAKQLHRFFGWDNVNLKKGTPFSVEADDCVCTENHIKGSVKVTKEESEAHPEYMCQWGEMEWDIKIDKQVSFNVGYGASNIFQTLKAFEMFWHAEGIKTMYEGYVIIDGEKYDIIPEKSYGYADKNWGKDFTSPWVWLSSCDLTSKITGKKLENSAFDIGGGRPKVGPIALERQLLSDFWYEGKSYEFNFSKFWKNVKTEFESHETDTQIVWHVDQKAGKYRMISDITCEKKDMLFVNYEAPDGQKRHNRLWNGGNGVGVIKLYEGDKLIDEVEAKHIGCEYGEYDPE